MRPSPPPPAVHPPLRATAPPPAEGAPVSGGDPGPDRSQAKVTGYARHHCMGCGEVHGFGRCAYASGRTQQSLRDPRFRWT